MTKTTVKTGVSLANGNEIKKSTVCQVIDGDNIVEMTPDEISEYGFKDGTVYVSRIIQIGNTPKSVFLERVVKGDINLYYLRDKTGRVFFIEKSDSVLIQLPEQIKSDGEDFRGLLFGLCSDCIDDKERFQIVHYTKKSVGKYIDYINGCGNKPFYRTRFGLIAGLGFTKFSPTASRKSYMNFDVFDFNYTGSLNAGLFIDEPILKTDFSLHLETLISINKFNDYQEANNKGYLLELNYSTLTVPLLLRYNSPYLRYNPFINFGPVLSYNFRNTNSLREISSFTEDFSGFYKIIPDNLLGFSIGAGAQKRITYRNFLFFEVRYSKMYGFKSFEFLNKGEINASLSISL